MADAEQLAILKQGVAAWNAWRRENPNVRVNLREAPLSEADLREANLGEADLVKADLVKADLREANLTRADLVKADLHRADLSLAFLNEADLRGADLTRADLIEADLRGANISEAFLIEADLREANLSEANLGGADLLWANLSLADLRGANLTGANLQMATLVRTDFTGADLTGCKIYGVSAWELKLDKDTKQRNLVITALTSREPEITVDNIEVAQFIYLLLYNPKIRDVINTIGNKAVLILGRFTPARKTVLDAIREELRRRDYVPILFDFDKPATQDLTATVSTLAHMARFIIADLTDPSSIPYELATVVPTTPVPVQPILLTGQKEFAMFMDLKRRYQWVLAPHSYDDLDQLIADLSEKVIGPAERKVLELRGGSKRGEGETS